MPPRGCFWSNAKVRAPGPCSSPVGGRCCTGGREFLDGFSQLVDWHFAEHYSLHHQAISTLLGADHRPLEVSFLLVAGMRRFVRDPLSQRRLAWWMRNVRLASHFRIKQYDDLAHEAAQCARRSMALADVTLPVDVHLPPRLSQAA